MKPYQLQPPRPSSHFPRMLEAKLRVVPNKHTSMSPTRLIQCKISELIAEQFLSKNMQQKETKIKY